MNLNFLNHQTKKVGVAAIILTASHLLSRLLGLIRDWLLARSFGAGEELDIYFAAFKIPDFIYNVVILGGILVAFLPLFSEYFSKDEDQAWDFVSNCINVFLILLISLCFILFFFAPALMKIIVPGFKALQFERTVFLTRLMLLSPIFFGLSSILSGVLQYFHRFLIYSLCPIIYNLGIIFGILFFTSKFGILGVVIGVIFGAFMHFAIQIPSLVNSGFKYKPILNFKDVKIKEVFSLMLPRAFGVSAQQLNWIAINAIASTLAVGSISILNFANNLRFFPLAAIGISFAVAVFPKLSKSWAQNKKEEFINSFSSAFRQIVYLVVPITILMFVLREQIIHLVLRHGEFSSQSASLTSASLGLFCFGILFASLRPLLFRGFFSVKDTKTPTLIALVFVIINIVLSLLFIQALKPNGSFNILSLKDFLTNSFSLYQINDISILGLPLAYLISLNVEFFLLFVFLKKRIGDFKIKEIANSLFKVFLAAFLMIIAIESVFFLFKPFFEFKDVSHLFYQVVIIGITGFSVYFLSTFLLGSSEILRVKSLLFNRFFNRIHDYEEH